MDDVVALATRLIDSLAPAGAPVPIRIPLLPDECRGFLLAVDRQVVRFETCPPGCFRVKKWGASGPDHFITPAGKPRHLFSKPVGSEAWLNREYVPHLAAYAVAIIEHGYSQRRSSFSLYRKFKGDLILRRAGGSYETDAEFYDSEGGIHLQIEAKASEQQTNALARSIEHHGTLSELPTTAVKELEYVLDLAPRYLWVVGPGSLDPPKFVYAVTLTGTMNASFTPLDGLPVAP